MSLERAHVFNRTDRKRAGAEDKVAIGVCLDHADQGSIGHEDRDFGAGLGRTLDSDLVAFDSLCGDRDRENYAGGAGRPRLSLGFGGLRFAGRCLLLGGIKEKRTA
jgi:hypothetical protein